MKWGIIKGGSPPNRCRTQGYTCHRAEGSAVGTWDCPELVLLGELLPMAESPPAPPAKVGTDGSECQHQTPEDSTCSAM